MTIFAFRQDEQGGDCSDVDVWVCASLEVEDVIESIMGKFSPECSFPVMLMKFCVACLCNMVP